jgi:hypothetical protein
VTVLLFLYDLSESIYVWFCKVPGASLILWLRNKFPLIQSYFMCHGKKCSFICAFKFPTLDFKVEFPALHCVSVIISCKRLNNLHTNDIQFEVLQLIST